MSTEEDGHRISSKELGPWEERGRMRLESVLKDVLSCEPKSGGGRSKSCGEVEMELRVRSQSVCRSRSYEGSSCSHVEKIRLRVRLSRAGKAERWEVDSPDDVTWDPGPSWN